MSLPDYEPSPEPVPRDHRRFQAIPIDRFVIDPELQRLADVERVQRMGNEWDWDQAEVPTGRLLPDGRVRVVEGQTRILALRYRGYRGTVMTAILPGEPSESHEADVAHAIATTRRLHSQLDQWLLRLRRGDPHEQAADVVLRRHGLRLGKSPSGRTIAAVGVIRQLVHGHSQTPQQGAELLDVLLTVIERAYPHHDEESATTRFDNRLLRSVGEVLKRNPNVSVDRLVATLQHRIAQQWVSQAFVMRDRAPTEVIGVAIIERYNRSLRNDARRLTW